MRGRSCLSCEALAVWDFGEGAKQEIWLVSLSHLPKPEIETPKSEIQNPKTGGRVWLMKE